MISEACDIDEMIDLGPLDIFLFSKPNQGPGCWSSICPVGTWLFVITEGEIDTTLPMVGENAWKTGAVALFSISKPVQSDHFVRRTGHLAGVFVHFTPDEATRFLGHDRSDYCVHIPAPRHDAAIRIARSMLDFPLDAPRREMFLAARAFELADEIAAQTDSGPASLLTTDSCSTGFSAAEARTLHQIADTVRRGEEVYLSVQQLADCHRLSSRRLTRGLRELCGISAHELIKQSRMARGMALLKTRQYSVKQVAAKIGYSQTYFSSEFRRVFGLSPSELSNGQSHKQVEIRKRMT